MATENKEGLAQVTALSSVGTMAAVIALALRKREPSEVSDETLAHLDQETMQLLAALAATVGAIKDLVENLKLNVQGYPLNTKTFLTFNVNVVVAGVAVRLPEFLVPDGFQLVVKNHPSNPVGTIMYIGKSLPDAQNVNSAWPLLINESLGLAVISSDAVWVAATGVSTLSCVVEQRT